MEDVARRTPILDPKTGMIYRPWTTDLMTVRHWHSIVKKGLVPIPNGPALDVGGHIGSFARAAIMGGATHVLSVEPEPDHIALWGSNLGGLPATLVRAAVGPRVGRTTLYVNEGKSKGMHSVYPARGRRAVDVLQTTLGSLIEGRRPAMLKVDVEGGEYLIPELHRLDEHPSIEVLHLEYHLGRRFLDQARELSQSVLDAGFVPLRAPKFDGRLWRTEAIYRR